MAFIPTSMGMKTTRKPTRYPICRYAGVSLSIFGLYNSEFYLGHSRKVIQVTDEVTSQLHFTLPWCGHHSLLSPASQHHWGTRPHLFLEVLLCLQADSDHMFLVSHIPSAYNWCRKICQPSNPLCHPSRSCVPSLQILCAVPSDPACCLPDRSINQLSQSTALKSSFLLHLLLWTVGLWRKGPSHKL